MNAVIFGFYDNMNDNNMIQIIYVQLYKYVAISSKWLMEADGNWPIMGN